MSDTYGRDSRYRQMGQTTRVDDAGRVLAVDEIRLRRPTSGTFRHTIDANDRLDHLAQRYYGKPRKWWLIADANPEFASPLAMLGQETLRTIELDVVKALDEHWSNVIRELRAMAGIDDVSFTATWPAVRSEKNNIDPSSGVLTVRYNEATIGAVAVKDAIDALLATGVGEAIGSKPIGAGAPRPITRIGRPLIIPPDQTG
jgi:hypothetical protein